MSQTCGSPLVFTFTIQQVSVQTAFPLNITGKVEASTSSILYNIPLGQNACPEVTEPGQLYFLDVRPSVLEDYFCHSVVRSAISEKGKQLPGPAWNPLLCFVLQRCRGCAFPMPGALCAGCCKGGCHPSSLSSLAASSSLAQHRMS